jgi:ATP-dependent DNA helicase RecQ
VRSPATKDTSPRRTKKTAATAEPAKAAKVAADKAPKATKAETSSPAKRTKATKPAKPATATRARAPRATSEEIAATPAVPAGEKKPRRRRSATRAPAAPEPFPPPPEGANGADRTVEPGAGIEPVASEDLAARAAPPAVPDVLAGAASAAEESSALHDDGALALQAEVGPAEDAWHDFGVADVDAAAAPQDGGRHAVDDDEVDAGDEASHAVEIDVAADDEDDEADARTHDDGGVDADDEEEEEEDDDTPLGETVSTDASGGLDPAVAAAARRLGIQRLYPEQERGIRETLAGRDVLIVMPTGFGKSACYQVPSMVLPKPVVLISPLLALLKDQHEKLIKYQVPAVRLDGTVRGKARAEALRRIAEGGSLLVMTTPETLASEEMHDALSKSGISLAAIDEAHCISEWGFDFRPAYLRLGEVLRGLGAPPMLGLTATATEKVRTDIVRFLGMRSPVIVASSPHRSNLAFEVLECREAARLRALARLAQRLRRPGIIYCSTTREVDTVYTILAKLGIPVHRYHGKMAAGERSTQQEMFMKPGRRTVMVATSAFGLGIDKPDIRYVVHQQSPASLEQYVQEAGRAGRDGAKANCILLHDPADRTVHEALLSRSRLRPDQLYKLGSALAAWAAEGRTPTIDALALSADLGERPTNALLATLEEADLVRISEDHTVRATVPPEDVEEKARSLAGQFANMRTQDARRLDSVADYAQSTECRAVYLRRYFGEEHGAPCALCDVCRGRPERPSTFWSPVASPKRMNKKRRRGRGRGAQMPQQQKRRRGGRGAPGRPGQHPMHARGGAPGGPQPQQRPLPNEQPGGPPREPHAHNAQDPNANGQQRRSRRRRRRGRRGRRGRPNPAAAPPAPPSGGA